MGTKTRDTSEIREKRKFLEEMNTRIDGWGYSKMITRELKAYFKGSINVLGWVLGERDGCL